MRLPRPIDPRLALVAVLAAVALAWSAESSSVREVDASPVRIPAPELDSCAAGANRDHRDQCYDTAMRRLVRADARKGIAQVLRHAAENRAFARRCHMLMHPLGRAYGGDVDIADIPHDGKDCAAGFVHGALEEQLGAEGALDARLARGFCGYARTPLQRADCEHGLGHVLMRNLGNDLAATLRRCSQIGDARFARHCASGAFMENRFAIAGRDDAQPPIVARADAGMCVAAPVAVMATCHGWAVRELPAATRLAHCGRVARGVSRIGGVRQRGSQTGAAALARACRVGTGAISRSGRPCRAHPECWFGRGYQVAGATFDPRFECSRAPVLAAARACAEGAGFRRGAGSRTGTAGDSRMHCAALFPLPSSDTGARHRLRGATEQAAGLRRACQRGFARRHEAVDFV